MAKFNFGKKTFQLFSGVFFLLLVNQFTTLLQAQVWQPGSGVMDIDGNQYPTLLYGNGQEWMGENLRTTKYTDGTPITYITTDADWMSQSVPMYQVTPAFCWYENDTLNKPIYGGLYSWYVTDPGSNGGKTVCPTGWHVPHSTEWNNLIDYLCGHNQKAVIVQTLILLLQSTVQETSLLAHTGQAQGKTRGSRESFQN